MTNETMPEVAAPGQLQIVGIRRCVEELACELAAKEGAISAMAANNYELAMALRRFQTHGAEVLAFCLTNADRIVVEITTSPDGLERYPSVRRVYLDVLMASREGVARAAVFITGCQRQGVFPPIDTCRECGGRQITKREAHDHGYAGALCDLRPCGEHHDAAEKCSSCRYEMEDER